MTPEIKGLQLLAASSGHRTPTGHIANTEANLLGVVPEHPDHARRRLQILARLTADLARSMSSHDRGSEPRDQAQRPGDRA